MLHPNTIIWDDIKRKRNGYLVEYQPSRYIPDNKSYPLATLHVTFLSQVSLQEAAQTLETEFKEWARLYPTYLMATAWDEAENMIDLASINHSDHITGFYDPQANEIVMHWGLLDEEKIPQELKEEARLKEVYKGISYRTALDVKRDVEQHVKEVRLGKKIILATLIFWLLVPLAIEIWGIANPFISTIIICYSFAKSIIALLKLLGKIKPSAREKEKSEKERKMAHYYHHCEKNPLGFLKLKSENFEQEAREKIKKEAEDLT